MSSTTARKIVQNAKRNPQITSAAIQDSLKTSGVAVSRCTIRRHLKLHGRVARRKPLLRKCHKVSHLQYAKQHRDKTQNFWNKCKQVYPQFQQNYSHFVAVMASCTTTAKDLPGSSADVLCPADCLTKGGSVWGTDVYTNDSSICRAAIHAGKIPNDGGQVSVHKTPGEASYNGSTRNGISTKNFGKWPGSFIFVTSTSTVTPEPTEGITQRLPVFCVQLTVLQMEHLFGELTCIQMIPPYVEQRSMLEKYPMMEDKSPCTRRQVRPVTMDLQEMGFPPRTLENGLDLLYFYTLTSTVTPEPTEGITQRLPVMASCTTTAKDLPGSSADVLCPADCLTNGGSVWGTDVYTNDSSICRAAIHAGKIPNDGGQVSVHKTPGEASYNGSTRNGISTKNFGKWPGSFIFVTSTSTVTPEPTGGITQRLPVMASCTTTAKDLPGSSADVLCPADCLTNGASVWGTDVYTNDSSICRAAIHAGKIPNDGGQVSVHKTPGEASYTGSTRNGISTKNFGKWPGSFIFVTSTSTVTPEPTEGITQRLPGIVQIIFGSKVSPWKMLPSELWQNIGIMCIILCNEKYTCHRDHLTFEVTLRGLNDRKYPKLGKSQYRYQYGLMHLSPRLGKISKKSVNFLLFFFHGWRYSWVCFSVPQFVRAYIEMVSGYCS
ncbi:unnamed protein product [Ranitomeya imitator]|uniref:LCCL domain-containing protein n=1 Tax=Ranitomeya imitator TaxID=111125 RepID=A0ABN9KPT1_9NEOB|nr:unnamed protein product [Ranitomeya imitator]